MKKKLIAALGFALIVLAVPIYGQEQEPEQTTIPVPINASQSADEERDSRAARSFSGAVSWNEQHSFGLTLSASEGRISDVFPNSADRRSSTLTGFAGGIFANYGRRKSRLHLDINAGYRMYHQSRDMDGGDYSGNITYTYKANRKVQFGLSDSLSSSLNDPFTSFNPSLRTTVDWTPSPSYAVVFMPQRLTQNVARAQIDVNFTRSTHVNVFGAFETYMYGDRSYTDSGAVQAGAGLDQRITDWLHLSSSYSGYLNQTDERLRQIQMHRIEIGRFRFSISRNAEIFFSGGIEIADDGRKYHTQGMFRAGISHSAEKNVIYANYQRTMTSTLGYSRVLPSDNVTVGIGRRFTSRTNLRLSGSYLRGSDFDYAGLLTGYSAQAQFEYALTSNLFISGNYNYQYQKNTIPVFVDLPHFDRSVVFVRLQFVWPSIRLRSE
jgi:hypothetical protein